MADTPTEITVPVEVGGRSIMMRPPSSEQMAALLDFERQAGLLAKLPDGEAKDKRSVTLARRSLVLIEHLMVDSEDWDWLMDAMMARQVDWLEFNDIPSRLFDALAGQGNRETRRGAAKATRTKKA